MDRKRPEPKIELPRAKSRDTRILMTWVEPEAQGARARVHVIVEEEYVIEGSYEAVRSLLRDKKSSALKMT